MMLYYNVVIKRTELTAQQNCLTNVPNAQSAITIQEMKYLLIYNMPVTVPNPCHILFHLIHTET